MDSDIKFDVKQILVFKIAGETFGTPVQSINEVIPVMKVEKVPRGPEFLDGLIHLRGESVAIIDLAEYFSHKRNSYPYEARILVTKAGDRKVGFIVDSVSDVRSLGESSVEEPIIHTSKTRFLLGVAHFKDGQAIQLVAMDKILDAESWKKLIKTDAGP